jgi:predicted TIM-barrel fold metal-dependent hydrolase
MTTDYICVISSDGHATGRMEEYRPYLEERFLEEFDAFVPEWNKHGSRNFDPPALERRLDPEYVETWKERMTNTGRLEGNSDPELRLKEMAREGISGEVLFPDFGLPFELYSGALASVLGYPPRDDEHIQAGNRAFNRWLADYVSVAPARFAGMAAVSWHDVDSAVKEIRYAHSVGLKGVVLPAFSPEVPLYHETYEAIWNVLDELGMVVNSHLAMSATSNQPIYTPGVPHIACATRIYSPEVMFFCHNILSHLIWGGVFERHPNLRFAFTEQGTSWVIATLRDFDYSYQGSYFRTDFHDVIRHKPSEYFQRQCFMGSSTFSRFEVESRHEIGLSNMMLGMDYPHHEGTLLEGTRNYLRATLGVAKVPLNEARMLLGENAARVFGFDLEQLAPVAAELAVTPESVLTPPEEDLFPRGDVNRPGSLFG